MVLGDFGNPHEGGFNSCYSKVVDQPQHFRAKPKQAPKLKMWQQSEGNATRPDYESSARYGCRARDHDDLLTSRGAADTGASPRMARRCGERAPTATIVNTHPVGGHAGVKDPNETGNTMQVGKKLISGAAHKTTANIRDPSTMPEAARAWPRKRESEFSSHNFMTMHDPSKYQQESKGKKMAEVRMTTGKDQWLTWQ